MAHEIDHIVAVKHGGTSSLDNLALCCTLCNKRKGTDLSAIDPETGEVVPLFHPRRDAWSAHFRLEGETIAGRTATGRATVKLLQLNRDERLVERRLLILAGQFTAADEGSP